MQGNHALQSTKSIVRPFFRLSINQRAAPAAANLNRLLLAGYSDLHNQ